MNRLNGTRIQLAASVPENLAPEQLKKLIDFVRLLTEEVLKQGGVLVHGSHPTLKGPIEEAGKEFAKGGDLTSVLLVRTKQYSNEPHELAEIEANRKWATVEVIPSLPGDPNTSLFPMREWMADRSDVVIAVGGKWTSIDKKRSGVPVEVQEMVIRGKPAFVIGAFGGSAKDLMNDPNIVTQLCNGWTIAENHEVSKISDPKQLVERILEQIKLLPIARPNIERGRRFRILALDGGGIRGVFTAAVLSKWAGIPNCNDGKDLAKHFDLIAGTSTGSIIALGLGKGLTPLELLEFYKKHGPTIFEGGGLLKHLIGSKYDATKLAGCLRATFDKALVSEHSFNRLVLPTVHAENGTAKVITTAHHKDRMGDKDLTMVNAALSSSAAPTYFNPASVRNKISESRYLDGGVWANNPILPAIAEAVRYLGIPPSRIEVLSVGTLGHESDYSRFLGTGLTKWARPVSNLFMDAQQSGSELIGENLLGVGKVLRVTQQVSDPLSLDCIKDIGMLARRGDLVGQEYLAEVRDRFFDGYLVPDWREQGV